MRRRTSRNVGLLVVVGILVWRIAGMPGLDREDASGIAASGYIGRHLDDLATALSAPQRPRVEPHIYVVPQADVGGESRDQPGGVGVVRAGRQAMPEGMAPVNVVRPVR